VWCAPCGCAGFDQSVNFAIMVRMSSVGTSTITEAAKAPRVELRDVSITYESTQKTTHALDHFNLSIAPGEPVAIIGPSGCGKTTLLNLIAALKMPDAGDVLIDGARITSPRQRTALILQDYGLLPWKTVTDNAALGLILRNVPRTHARHQAIEALSIVGLEEFAHAFPAELSGGMRQRLALARALSLDCDIMLMDEPLSALDALTREELQNTLLDLWQRQGYAQILVTHSIEEAVFLGRRIVLMTPRPGRISAVIDNPAMGAHNFRQTPEFFDVCTLLRKKLAGECVHDGCIHGAEERS